MVDNKVDIMIDNVVDNTVDQVLYTVMSDKVVDIKDDDEYNDVDNMLKMWLTI